MIRINWKEDIWKQIKPLVSSASLSYLDDIDEAIQVLYVNSIINRKEQQNISRKFRKEVYQCIKDFEEEKRWK